MTVLTAVRTPGTCIIENSQAPLTRTKVLQIHLKTTVSDPDDIKQAQRVKMTSLCVFESVLTCQTARSLECGVGVQIMRDLVLVGGVQHTLSG